MMKHTRTRLLRTILLTAFPVLFLCPFLYLPASANSAQRFWSGTNAAGAQIIESSCPLVIKHELLTFHLPEFPKSYYETQQDFLSYPGNVTAQYTVHNPSDYTVTATLAFPFGAVPDYAPTPEHSGSPYSQPQDTDPYQITVNNAPIHKTLRHTYSHYNEQFFPDTDLARLVDGYEEDDFFSPDLPVKKYTFRAEQVDTETYNAATAACSFRIDPNKTRIYMEQQSGFSLLGDTLQLSTWIDEDTAFSVYIIGEPLETFPEWNFYENGACEKEISGTMKQVETADLTYKSFALSAYDPASQISDTDWYNAVTQSLNHNAEEDGTIISSNITLDVSRQLMRWYEYELTLKPKETLTHTVTAPVYPYINAAYDPTVYAYEYLLSPATTWADFGSLDIVIDTPYLIPEDNLRGPFPFEKTSSGYQLSLDKLPDSELIFSLCTEEKPKAPKGFHADPNLIRALVIIAIALFISILLGIRNYNRTRR